MTNRIDIPCDACCRGSSIMPLFLLLFLSAVAIVATTVSTVESAYAFWDILEKKKALDEAQKEADKAALECLLLEGYDYCALVCSNPGVNNPMLCLETLNKVNEKVSKK
jgi:hypothetical protein